MYQLLGGARNNNDSEDDSSLEENLLKLKNYTYFDGDKILASLKLSAKDKKNGEAIYRQNKVNISDISSGYSHLGERCGQADAVFNVKRDTFHTTIIFNNKEVTYARCHCPECSRKYWGWYSDNAKCQYTAALAFYIKDFVKQNNFADATDMNGDYLLSTYRKGQIKNTQKDSQLSVSFKVGTDKLFIVKKQSPCQTFPAMDSFISRWAAIHYLIFTTMYCPSYRISLILRKKILKNSGSI